MQFKLPLGISIDPFWWIDADTRAAEVVSALFLLVWFVHSLLNPDLMIGSPGYQQFAILFGSPSTAYGVWSGLLAASWILQSLAMCGHVNKLRFPSAMMSMAIWTMAAGVFTSAAPSMVFGHFCMVMAGMMLWVVIKGPTHSGN